MAAIEGVEDDVQLGLIFAIVVVFAVVAYWAYSKFEDLASKDGPDTGVSNAFGDSNADTSTISKALDNTLSLDTPETKAGYGPTYSQAGLQSVSHPWDTIKSIFGVN